MLYKVGYSLVDLETSQEVMFWGDTIGSLSTPPVEIILPNRDAVYGFHLGETFQNTYKFVERWIDASPETEWHKHIDQQILIQNDRVVVQYIYELPHIEILKTKIKAKIAEKRWEIEISGVTDSNDITFATDRESQTKYIAIAVKLLSVDVSTWSIHWKTVNGNFVTLNASEMQNVINLVMNHVQTCFDKESDLHSLLDAATTYEEVFSIDITTGW